MPPRKAKLHSTTGKLKEINKTYSTPAPASSSSSARNATQSSVNGAVTETALPASADMSAMSSRPAGHDSAAEQQFELELYWCIQNLEKTLQAGTLNAKQGKFATFQLLRPLIAATS